MARRLTAEKAQERREAKSARKLDQLFRADSVSGAGMSLIQKLEEEATEAARKYNWSQQALASVVTVDEDYTVRKQLNIDRGILRGVVIGVAMIRCPYELRDDRAKTLKRMELEFVKKAKSQIEASDQADRLDNS